MNLKRTKFWLVLIVGMQLAWIFGSAASKEFTLNSGQTILLETVPVDPRDLLRGDYVILNYKISSVPSAWIGTIEENSNIYVTLKKEGKYHVAAAVSREPLKVGNEEVLVKGQTRHSWWGISQSIQIDYGIEQYFVEEGTGNPIGNVTVECAVGDDGTLMIRQVFIDGVPYAEAMKGKLR